MNINSLENIICKNLDNKTHEFKRVFHGRGKYYEGFEYLTVDSINKTLFITLYEKLDIKLQERLLNLFKKIYEKYSFEALVLQKRYLNNGLNEIVLGSLKHDEYAIENNLKYFINFDNKNIGFFADMKKGREFIYENSKDKKVLNLFSYTCSFSVCAIAGKAKEVVNVDMSKSALTTGRINHQINQLDTKKVKFLPHNILKSWGKLKRLAPFDIIIIDPPSFQKGSFAATKDYEKIIKKLNSLASENCIVLSALNAPELDTNFIKNLFDKYASEFKYIKRLDNLDEFICSDEQRSLKNMIFQKV